jgi:hypothetical protein
MDKFVAFAQAEGLDLQARRRNPTGQGIHNKMVLAQIGGRGWVIAGSLERRRGLGEAEPGDRAAGGGGRGLRLPGRRVLVRLGCDAVSCRGA